MSEDRERATGEAAPSDSPGPAPGPSPIFASLILALLSIPLVFVGLGSYSLVNGDEAIYQLTALRMLDTGDWLTLQDGVELRVYDTFMNAPLQYWARAVLVTVMGEGLWSTRLLSALFAVATVLVTHRLALRLSRGDRWAAFLAGFVQLTTYQFLFLHGARTGELETLVSFLVTAALLLFLRAVARGSGFWLHHLCLAALLMTKLPLPLLPVAAELLWFAVTPDARRHAKRWLLQGLAVLPLALAWHAFQAVRLGPAFGEVMATMAHEARSGSVGHEAGRVSNWSYYAWRLPFGTYPWGLLFPLALVFGLVRGVKLRRNDELLLPVFLVLVVGGFYLAVEKHAPWYPTPAYPALAVLVGLGFAGLGRARGVSLAVLGALALALALLPWLDVALTTHHPFDRTAQQMGMRTRWRALAGLAPALGVGLTWALTAGGLLLLARRTGGRGVALATLVPFAAVALVRCLAPLQHLGHQSEVAEIRARIDARVAAGKPVRYPVAVPDTQVWIVRALFARDHEIVDRRRRADQDQGAAYLLNPREQTVDR